MKLLIKNGKVYNEEASFIQGDILIEDKKIVKVEEDIVEDTDKVIDAQGHYVVPALIDTHTHGAIGFDFNTCQKEDIDKIAEYYRQEGVSTFMASLVCESHEDTKKLLQVYEQSNCSSLAGIHLEGPYLNLNKKAVMKEECIRKPDLNEFKEYLTLSSKIRSMTIAPELDTALKLISYANEKEIVMNIGHSDGDAQVVLQAEKAGAKGITHLYNAMTQHEHRSPGIVTGAFLSNLYCELIVDGFHVHEDVVKATYQTIGKDRIILISDANPCKGLKDGEYPFSGKQVIIKDQKATLKDTGRIAGSTLTMQKACQNMMEYCKVGIHECIQMASTNPSKLYGLNKGSIKEGYDADILIIDDTFEILHMISDNKIWY